MKKVYPESYRRGFVLPLVIGLILATFLLLGSYRYLNGKNFWQSKGAKNVINEMQNQKDKVQKRPNLTSKTLDTPSFVVYTKQTTSTTGENSTGKNRIFIASEDGNNKKEISKLTQKPGIFGAENFYIDNAEKRVYYNSRGEIDNTLNDFLKKYDELVNAENKPTWTKGMRYGWSSYAFSTGADLFAYARIGETNIDSEIVILNLDSGEQKIFNIRNPNLEEGFTFYFSPDDKKLYACIDKGFYFDGPVRGIWEFNLETSKATELTDIEKLKIKKCEFRYNPNTLYGAHYEEYGVVAQYEGQPVNRSKSVYKIDLDTNKIETINFQNFFHDLNISKNGTFAISSYNDSEDVFNKPLRIVNLKNGEEFNTKIVFQNYDEKAWSDSDKLAIKTYDTNYTKLYVVDPVSRKETLIDSQDRDTTKYFDTIELIGWLH